MGCAFYDGRDHRDYDRTKLSKILTGLSIVDNFGFWLERFP
jgi:hypothetical protein